MKNINARTMGNQFKRSFSETRLNELGRLTRFCHRERSVTPHRLAVTMVEAFASGDIETIADLQRAFNALCEQTVQYKPFHNQLAKRQFPTFMRSLLTRLMNELAMDVLRFSPDSPFARFRHIRLQDGTSFALKDTLADAFPGRFTTISPAAVELHVNMDLLTETLHSVVLRPDRDAEGQFLPPPADLAGDLLLADRGYFDKHYCIAMHRAQSSFIVRGKANLNPLILHAFDHKGQEIKCWRGQRLKEVAHKITRRSAVDLDVRFQSKDGPFDCRLVATPNPREESPRYLVTNLNRTDFSLAHLSDGYRLRWQIELLFKEWKSYANLKAFDTSNPHIAEGLIWAALCAATLSRYCAHMTQRLTHCPISTRRVAMCIRHVLNRDLAGVAQRTSQGYSGARACHRVFIQQRATCTPQARHKNRTPQTPIAARLRRSLRTNVCALHCTRVACTRPARRSDGREAARGSPVSSPSRHGRPSLECRREVLRDHRPSSFDG